MHKDEIETMLDALPLRYERDAYDHFLKKSKCTPSFPCVNIVGSNGKSATAIYLSSIYSSTYKVGLLINQYLNSSLECIRYNGEPISEEDFSRIYEEERKRIEKEELSRWEILSYIAYRYFEEKKVDIAILESSLGGAVDASFIEDADQRLVILTSLSLEHTQYLGTTISQIALNKVSLLKEDSKLLVCPLNDEIRLLLLDYASSMDAGFYVVDAAHFEKVVDGSYQFHYRPYQTVTISSLAKYLIKDASLALEACSLLKDQFPVDEEKVLEAVKKVKIPCMNELVLDDVFDLASNTEASEALVESLSVYHRPVYFLFAANREMNIATILPFLSNYCVSSIITSCPGPNMRHEEGYFFYLEDYEYIDDPKMAYAKLRGEHPSDLILITGSKNFVTYMRRELVK